MIRSMTGFGAAEGMVGMARVTVELRSVNHRFFNSTIRLPSELARWETEVREALRRRVVRGHVTLSARLERDAVGQFSVDEARFASAAALLRGLRDRHGLEGPVDIAAVMRMPEGSFSMTACAPLRSLAPTMRGRSASASICPKPMFSLAAR